MKFLSYLRVMTLSQRLMPILLLALMTNTVAAAAAEQALATNCLTLPELRKKWEGPPLAQVIQAAEQGSADAMTRLYFCYWDGLGTAGDQVKAMKWLTQAAEAGHPLAQYFMAYRCLNPCLVGDEGNLRSPKPDLHRSLYWYRRSAEQHQPNSQYHLGLLYLEGGVVEANEAKALTLIRAAADQGNADALGELARLYAEGIGEPRDSQDRPLELLKRAGAWGVLVFRYEYGLGTERDLVAAARCYCRAALSGGEYRPSLADKIEFHPSKRQMSCTLITPSDNHLQIYGPLHESGSDPTDNLLRALSLYLKAAKGDGPAAMQIGQRYLTGEDAPRDPLQAWLWVSIAARNRQAGASEKLPAIESRLTEPELKVARDGLPELIQELALAAAAVGSQ